MKKRIALGCLPIVGIFMLVLLFLSTLLGGNISSNASTNAPAGVSDSQLATANAIVTRLKKEVPKATTNGLAAVLGCFQAESSLRAKSAEGDYLAYPVGAGKEPDSETYDNVKWLDLGGAAIYGASSPYAKNIQERGLGLGQYTNERNLALQAYAKSVHSPWYNLNTQLEYILKADGDAETLKSILQETGSVTQTTTDMLKEYERGGYSGLQERIAYAKAWANYLSNPNVGGASGEASTKGSLSSVNALIGQKVGSGQCYALSQWYVQKISNFRLVGMNAKDIGSDNAAALKAAGWTVIAQPKASDLKAGAVVCWGDGSMSRSVYGHRGIINAVSGNNFTTYEQNMNGNQTVQMYSRMWDASMTFVIVPPKK